MDPTEIRRNTTRSGAPYLLPAEDFALGGNPVPAALHIPANTSQTCLAGEGHTPSDGNTSPRCDEAPLGPHPGDELVSPLIPANTSQKCFAGEGITAPPQTDGGVMAEHLWVRT